MPDAPVNMSFMTHQNWREFWETKASPDMSDLAFDRGSSPRDESIDKLANEELLDFIDCKCSDVVFDAGCGSGVNLLLLRGKVQRIIAMDYARAAIVRCRNRLLECTIDNVHLLQ